MTKRDADDTFEVLMTKLAGFEKPPRQPQAAHIWGQSNSEHLATVIEKAWEERPNKAAKKRPVNFGADIVRKAFIALSAEEKQKWVAAAKERGDAAKAEYQKALREPPSTDPEARAL